MHVHGGDLQHPAADGGGSLLTHRGGETERETDRRGTGYMGGWRKMETVRLEKGARVGFVLALKAAVMT